MADRARTASARQPAEVVDALGLLCPLPILRTAAAARRWPPGSTIELLSDDDGVLEDLPDWCEGNGHDLLAIGRRPTRGAEAAYCCLVRLG